MRNQFAAYRLPSMDLVCDRIRDRIVLLISAGGAAVMAFERFSVAFQYHANAINITDTEFTVEVAIDCEMRYTIAQWVGEPFRPAASPLVASRN